MGTRTGGGGAREGTCPPPRNSKIWGTLKDNLMRKK